MPEALGSGRHSTSASPHLTTRRTRTALVSSLSLAAICLTATAVWAQSTGLRPGEAYLTRFSGAVAGPAGPMIDTSGTVGSIIDLREPGRPPQGEHWADEPQRRPVTAAEVGQVFGVVLDEANPPNVYLSATAAFGLHTQPGTAQWMPGMWGQGGGPGTIWRLDAASGYRPQRLADVTTGGRPNSGAALGNMAYDRVARQIFVSDMETGLIHRIDAARGTDLGVWDHGTTGRARFVDAASGQPGGLAPIAFDPSSRARVSDCPTGAFDKTPDCWNLAPAGRRVWGIGLRRDPGTSARRLYYAVWSGPGGTGSTWNAASDEDKRSAVWSVGLGPDGGFDPSDVRREFLVPDFFVEGKDVARAGFSRPVSDITFAECSSKPVMLIAERGGHRNLGLGNVDAFAWPHEARTLSYEMDQSGNWEPVGRYDVGYYDRKKEGVPYMRANCAGGAAFGYGYKEDFSSIDTAAPGEFVWITGDALCSAEGPCRAPAGAEGAQPAAAQDAAADGSEVHGLQGTPAAAVDSLTPPASYAAYPQNGEPYPAAGPDQSYLIDADVNLKPDGQGIEVEFTRSDATFIGDVAIFAVCNPPAPINKVDLLPPRPPMPPPPPPRTGVVIEQPPMTVVEVEGHDPVLTHATIASHGATSSHFRIASHNPWLSHDRFRSHNRWRSHDVLMSRPVHRPVGSFHRPAGSFHRPVGSLHYPRGSLHRPVGSLHRPIGSFHRPPGSIHVPRGSIHRPQGSFHRPIGSVHRPPGSLHRPIGSLHNPRGSAHNPRASVHRPLGSVGPTHRPLGSVGPTHKPRGSIVDPVHRPRGSVIGPTHRPPGSIVTPTHKPRGSVVTPVHRPHGSVVTPVHRPRGSVVTPVHRPRGSVAVHRPAGSVVKPVHRPAGSVVKPVHRPAGSVVRAPPRPVGPVGKPVHRPAGSSVR